MATLTIPNTINNGDALDAGPVMANFQAIESHVNTHVVDKSGSVAMTGPLTLPGLPTQPNHAATKQYVDQLEGTIAGAVPTGTLTMYAGGVAPSGWLLCDGSAVSRVAYSDLFGVIGVTYGAGDGSTTFNLPDMRGRVAFGLAAADAMFDTLGESGGAKSVTLSESNLPAHSHSVSLTTGAGSPHTHSITVASGGVHEHTGATTSSTGSHTHTGTTGTESATHTHQYNSAVSTGVQAYSSGTPTYVESAADNLVPSEANSTTHTHSFTTGSAGSHSHTVTVPNTDSAHSHTATAANESAHTHSVSGSTGSTGSGSAVNIVNPYLVVNFIIKT